jgi:7-cyano-7-deazaguanine synthase in queuosine biosynthesis
MTAKLSDRFSVDIRGCVAGRLTTGGGIGHIAAPGLSQPVGWLDPFAVDARDLLRVGMAIFQADRLSLRAPSGTRGLDRDLAWSREVSLNIELERPDRWKKVSESLQELLWFLTDDRWAVTFSAPKKGRVGSQQVLFRTPVPADAELALFSGGLDSTAGLRARSIAAPARTFIAVSVCGNSHRRKVQREAIDALEQASVPISWIRFDQQLRSAAKLEITQRTRGLLFFSVGAAVARTAGLPRVSTYECGPGALNLSLNEGQIGAQNTRANHPLTLSYLQRILAQVLDAPVELCAPFALSTKGEMCRAAGSALASLATRTISCDEGEHGKLDPHVQCGICTSCLLRRAALHAALGSKDPTDYACHATSKHSDYDVQAFRLQALRLSALTGWQELVEYAPEVHGVEVALAAGGLTKLECQTKIVEMLQRHAQEVLSFFTTCSPIVLGRPRRPRTQPGGNRGLFPATR